MTDPSWEPYGDGLDRFKVPGGYIYRSFRGMVFVPTTAVVDEHFKTGAVPD